MAAEFGRALKDTPRAEGCDEILLPGEPEWRSKAERERTGILAEAERDAQILRGEGDAEAIRIFAEAFNQDPDFFAFYRSMEAYRRSFGGDDTTMVLSPESEFFDFFGDARGTGRSPGE